MDRPGYSGNRNYAFDAARGTLMTLGIVLHVADVYSVAAAWDISDSERSSFFDVLAWFIHEFRMESFYWISGYFCAMTFQKRGVSGLLRTRMFRIAVPLTMTWLTLNVAQEAIVAWWNHLEVLPQVLDGVGPMHLWFLVDLLFYIALAALVLSTGGPLLDRLCRWWRWGPVPLILVMTAGSYGLALLVRMTGFAYDEPLGITEPMRLASYFPYFAAGVIMFRGGAMRTAFFRPNIFMLLLIAVPLSVCAAYLQAGHARLMVESGAVLDILAKWMMVSAVIGAFQRWVAAPSVLGNFMSDASYTIYLFHHVTVVMIGILVMPLHIGPYLKFLIVAGVTLGITAAIHRYVILRVPLLRLLYNGRR